MACTNLEATFCSFFQGWLERQQIFLDKLLNVSNTQPSNVDKTNNNKEHTLLIEQVLAHYAEYCEQKSRVIWQDSFLVFSPPWLTSIEKTILWVGGFKPSLALSLVEANFMDDINPQQIKSLDELKAETSREERTVMEEFAMVQERVASMPLMKLLKDSGRLVDGEVFELEDAMQVLKDAIARVVQVADNLRRNTTMKVLGILDVNQCLKFLTAIGKHQLGLRNFGGAIF